MCLAESWICHCGMGIDDEHHFLFECPYYHDFRQFLEQSVQDTLLTGPNFVAVIDHGPTTICIEDSAQISWRPHLNIFNKLVSDSISISAHCSFLYFWINKTAKQQKYYIRARLLVKDMFLSVCHRYQCMDHNSVCYDSGEWLLCEIWCIETTPSSSKLV